MQLEEKKMNKTIENIIKDSHSLDKLQNSSI